MLTEFGKALRKIRIDREELLKDMADVLGVSVAYLSAVENGKRRIPPEWIEKICKAYQCDEPDRQALQWAADESAINITIPLEGVSPLKRDAVLTFARTLDGMSDEELTKIMSTMKKRGRGHNNGRRA